MEGSSSTSTSDNNGGGHPAPAVLDSSSFSTATTTRTAASMALSRLLTSPGVATERNAQPAMTTTATLLGYGENLKQRSTGPKLGGGAANEGQFRSTATSITTATAAQENDEVQPKAEPSSFRRILIDFIVFPLAAALLMHAPGLTIKLNFENFWPDYVKSIIAAAVEGLFLLLLGMVAFVAGRTLYVFLEERLFCGGHRSTEKNEWSRDRKALLFHIAYLSASTLVAAWSFNFILSSILGDAAFRVLSGNDSPSAESLQAWSGISKAYSVMRDVHYYEDMDQHTMRHFWNLVFAMSCLVGSVGLFAYPFRKHRMLTHFWSLHRRRSNDKLGDQGTGLGNGSGSASNLGSPTQKGSLDITASQVAPAVAAAKRDIESRLCETEKTSATRCSTIRLFCGHPKQLKVLKAYILGSLVLLGCMSCHLNSLGWYTPVVFAYFSIFWGQEDMMSLSVDGMTRMKSLMQPTPESSSSEVMVADDSSSSVEHNNMQSQQQLPGEGVFASLINSILNNHENPRSAEISSCQDILLYLPDATAPVSRQFHSYFRAAILSTFMNKALVVVEKPNEKICTLWEKWEAKKKKLSFPQLLLEDMVEIPGWVSGKCSVPCRETHDHFGWESIRQEQNSGASDINGDMTSFDPIEHVCTNDHGQQTKLFVVGADDVHMYFENQFLTMMTTLQQQHHMSPLMHDWAIRLGATPGEAETFTHLQGQPMWDYLSALMMRSGILKLTPQLEQDVNIFIEDEIDAKNNLRKFYDAIEVKHGPALLENNIEAKNYIVNYWESRWQYDQQDYIPFSRYLEHITNDECDSNVHRIFVSTNDPEGVRREISEMGTEKDGIVNVNACHKIRFTVSKASEEREVYKGCMDRYKGYVASIAGFVVLSRAQTYVSTMYSDFGKLVRISRLVLNNKDPVLLKDMKVAWGRTDPGPP